MEQKQHKHGLGSYAWAIPLLIGLALVFLWIGRIDSAFEELAGEPGLVGEFLLNIAVIFIPFGLISWFLWAMRGKRMPSLAFVVTLITGGFFFLFSLAECIGGFASRPIEWTSAVGGLMQITIFALPFFTVAWLLWFRPKIGAIVLICIGAAMGTWMVIDWNLQNMQTWDDWMIPGILAGLPVVLGAYTLVREILAKKGQPMLKNAD